MAPCKGNREHTCCEPPSREQTAALHAPGVISRALCIAFSGDADDKHIPKYIFDAIVKGLQNVLFSNCSLQVYTNGIDSLKYIAFVY